MSWINALTETYDRYFDGAVLDDPHPLVPVAFIEKKIGIRVNINRDATFHSAHLLSSKDVLLVPSDPAAESRVGPPVPYPLCDEIRYTAGDLSDYADEDYTAYFSSYIDKLSRWCENGNAPHDLKILLEYLQKRSFASDMMKSGTVPADKNGFFPVKYRKLIADFCVYDNSEFKSLCEINSVRTGWQQALLDTMTAKGLSYI